MKKRVLALLLCLSMFLGMVPAQAHEPEQDAQPQVLSLQMEEDTVETVELPENEKATLTADPVDADSYQWQILAVPALDLWVDIFGQTEYQCNLSYPMVANLLDEDNSVQIRCKSVMDGETVMSDTVTVVVTAPTEPEPLPAPSEEPIIVAEPIVEPIEEPVEEPVEEPEVEPSAEPAEEPEAEPSAEPTEEPEAEPSAEPSQEPAAEPATVARAVRRFAVNDYSVDALDDGENKTYNVVINYVFENNDIVADPYTANLAAGSSFSATVTFPVVMGYLPYVDENAETSASMVLNITNIQADVTYTVTYKPTNVNYTVIHYQQNLDNDNYTEFERETKQGLTNSTVPEVANTYEGFYALLYEKPAIAANGSTVVEVYYDRYYYLMNFDLDGGYGVEPIYARYGTEIGDVGTPTKAGYTFKGWSLDGTTVVDLPETMPAGNVTYKAVWEADNTAKVTIVFWGENADDEEYSYIKSAEVNVKPGIEFTYNESGSLICGLEVHQHNVNDCYELTCTKEVHTHDDSCYTCGQTEHTTHTTACYAGVGNRQNVYTGVPDNPADGQVIDHWVYGKLIYIGGSWYKYSGSTGDGDIAPTTCHKHSDACLGCGKTGHSHSVENGCYKLTCTKTEHTHTSDCYMSGAGLDSNLWTFKESDTVTVAADGSTVVNVYYDRTEKTLTFKYNYSNRNYQSTETITAKWGANIADQYKKIAANAGSTFWSAETSGNGPYTNYFGVMPETSKTYYNRGTTGSDGTMTYWGQDLNGNYTIKLFEVTGVGGYTVTSEDRYEFEGFTYDHGTSNGSSCSGAAFYYTRNSYNLTFNDGYNDVRTESVKYEAPLSAYSDYVPSVPSAYEPGSVVFGGWYLNPECSGAEYVLDEHTMPAENVLLYAKWEPVSHYVRFSLDKDAYEKAEELADYPVRSVPHGGKIDVADPTNGSYTFVSWFYMDGDQEKAFDFANMPITKDLWVYGKWSSNVLKQYTIYYKIQGTDTEIAAPTTGSGLAGVTKTFEAKGGTELYADYQEGYFPVTKSHSMTLDIENEDNNTFIFWYVQKEAVPYTVKYLNKETGEPVADEKVVSDNRKAVVTETFVPVSGMMPDAYQKRLVVSGEDGAVNEIIFYYTEDTTHAYYKITHYTENTDGVTWTEYASSQAVGDINKVYTAEPMTIPGFTYSAVISTASGELTAAGLELKLYYTRNSYPYQVRYLEQGSGKQLANPKNSTGKYGEVVSESAISIANYTAVAPASQTLNIRIEESQTEAKLNIITFYYTEDEVTINYKMVGPDGTVSENLKESYGSITSAGETLKVLSGTASGSTATASSNAYKFVGWYSDQDCTTLVSADATFVPKKVDGEPWTNTTYYAKFEYNVFDLTITKTMKDGITAEQDFIFDVKKDGTVVTTVVIKAADVTAGHGSASVTITGLQAPVDGYTVVEREDWSWKHKLTGQTGITLKGGTVNAYEVSFTNGESDSNWMGATSIKTNDFTNVSAASYNTDALVPDKPTVVDDGPADNDEKGGVEDAE